MLPEPISHRLDHMLSGVRAEIALETYGEHLEQLRAAAERLRERIDGIEGDVDPQVERQVRIPQLRVALRPPGHGVGRLRRLRWDKAPVRSSAIMPG